MDGLGDGNSDLLFGGVIFVLLLIGTCNIYTIHIRILYCTILYYTMNI